MSKPRLEKGKGVKNVKSTVKFELMRKVSMSEDEYAVACKVECVDDITKDEALEIAISVAKSLKCVAPVKINLKHADHDEEDIVLDPNLNIFEEEPEEETEEADPPKGNLKKL